IGEGRGFGVVEPVEYFYHAALLGDENAPLARDSGSGRVVQAADGDGLLEAGGNRRRGAGGRADPEDARRGRPQDSKGQAKKHGSPPADPPPPCRHSRSTAQPPNG